MCISWEMCIKIGFDIWFNARPDWWWKALVFRIVLATSLPMAWVWNVWYCFPTCAQVKSIWIFFFHKPIQKALTLWSHLYYFHGGCMCFLEQCWTLFNCISNPRELQYYSHFCLGLVCWRKKVIYNWDGISRKFENFHFGGNYSIEVKQSKASWDQV